MSEKALIKTGHYNIEIDFLDTHTAKVIYLVGSISEHLNTFKKLKCKFISRNPHFAFYTFVFSIYAR